MLRYNIIGLHCREISSNRCENESGEKWHYDEAEGSCAPFDYIGCFGTDNVFDDEESCNAICVIKNSTLE